MVAILVLKLSGFEACSDVVNFGVFPKALWFLHEFGHSDCSSANRDRYVKSVFAKSVAAHRELTLEKLNGLIDSRFFQKFSGDDNRLWSLSFYDLRRKSRLRNRRFHSNVVFAQGGSCIGSVPYRESA